MDFNEECISLLASVSSVDLNGAGGTETALYTVPEGKEFVPDHIKPVDMSDDALAAVITLGKSGGSCDEFLGDTKLANVDGTTKTTKLQPLLHRLKGSDTWDPGSIADGDEEAKAVTVTGAALGDYVKVSFSLDVADLVLDAKVTAADTVTCILANNTGGAIDLASGTIKVEVFKFDQPPAWTVLTAGEIFACEITTPAGAACTCTMLVFGHERDA